MKPLFPLFLIFSLSFAFRLSPFAFSQSLENQNLKATISPRGLTSLTCPQDTTRANIFSGAFGKPVVRYRVGPGDWLDLYQEETRMKAKGERRKAKDEDSKIQEGKIGQGVVYEDFIPGMPLKMTQTYSLREKSLDYQIEIESMMEFPVTIGDLAIPFPWRTPGGEDPVYIFEQCFTKHHFIQGNGSFLCFTKPSGMPPYLLVTVQPGTSFEYFTGRGSYQAFIHSGLTAGRETRGTWRQPNTMLELGKAGSATAKKTYGLRFQWAQSFDELRQLLYENGLFDIRVVPGMTIPSDLSARFSLHTKNQIDSITAEYRDKTTITFLREFPDDHLQYQVTFRKPGENKLTIWYNHGLKTYLEFFSCEPLETLFKKRSAFIVNHQQHRDSTKWYNGLYSVYDMKEKVLRGPDNTDGFDYWWGYVLACDDPALCKAPFVAAKNVVYPDAAEIASVEYYLKNFVWGKLQRTDQETPYPYGIYGTPNWMANRDPLLRAGMKNRNLDKMNVWRSYDYPHIIMLYWHMYQIAKLYPDKVHYLTADEYLERAYQTAVAYFKYPYEILPWYETYKWGCYNELVIPDIIDELTARAVETHYNASLPRTSAKSTVETHNNASLPRTSAESTVETDNNPSLQRSSAGERAKILRDEWEKKVKYFVYDDTYPFRSEYSLDRTAFESSYALAKYGTLNKMEPDTNLWFDKKYQKWYSHPVVKQEDARKFMDRQLMGGLAVRGWLETTYYLLGADFTSSSDGGSMSYMANMGGWGILDYGINFSEKPDDWIQLGYASYLCHWALMNSGRPEDNYGYWYPGVENDGASGWTFNNSKWGNAWIRKEVPRGPWSYDGEIDLGYGSSTRMARTIVMRDAIFGWIGYGGELVHQGKEFSIIPRDGLRTRFSAIDGARRVSVELERDGFAAEVPIRLADNFGKISFVIEDRRPTTEDGRKTGDGRPMTDGGLRSSVIGLPSAHHSLLSIHSTLPTPPRLTANGKIIRGEKSGEKWVFSVPVNKLKTSIELTLH